MPATGAMIELLLAGVWTDITPYVYLRDRITITRGRQDQASRVDPGSCTLTLNNKSGRFSPRLATGPYYSLIGRNTPVRVSTAAGSPFLGLTDGTTPVTRVSTPSTSALNILGDLDVRFDVQPVDWFSNNVVELGGKWGPAGQRGWVCYLFAGELRLSYTTDGSTSIVSSAALDDTELRPRMVVRATLDVNNGAGGHTVRFYVGPTMAGPWTQVGSDVVSGGTAATASTTAAVEVGDVANFLAAGNAAARLYAAQIRSGIDGTVVAAPDVTVQAPGATSFTDGAGVHWTASSATAITNRRTRFVGEISEWPTRWDVSGGDVYVQVQAAGIMRRLGKGADALGSAMRRAVSNAGPLVYWPMEDGSQATQAASGLNGGAPLRVTGGSPSFGATDGPLGSLQLPDFSNGGSLAAPVVGGSGASWTIETLVKFGTTLPAGFVAPLGWNAAGSRANAWEIDAFPPDPVNGGGLAIQWANTAFSDFGGPYYSNVNVVDGQWHHVRVTVAQSGTAISIAMWIDGKQVINTSEPSVTLGAIQTVLANPYFTANAGVPSMGHLAVWSPSTTAPTWQAVTGYDGDTAAGRIARLSAEQGVPVVWPYGQANTQQVGPQATDTFLNLVGAAGDVDMGILHEHAESVALAYRPRTTLYNQAPALALDYEAHGEVAPPLEPTEDDTTTQNDVTVSRTGGSSAQATVDTGPLSTLPPPAGVGRYAVTNTLAAHSDDQLPDLAGWQVHLGTWDGQRFPAVTVNLAAAPHLVDQVTAVESGDRVTIDNPPPWLPPEQIDLLAQGYTETLGWAEWLITFNCTPGGPWRIGTIEDADSPARFDTEGCKLAAGVNATATSWSVTTTKGARWVDSATYPEEFPFDWLVGGERVTVTAITGTGTTQTATVIRSVNGVVKAQAANAAIALADPTIIGL